MNGFVEHVNRCLSCEIVPEMTLKIYGWLIYCPECGLQTTNEDSVKAIEQWNQDNPEPVKVRRQT